MAIEYLKGKYHKKYPHKNYKNVNKNLIRGHLDTHFREYIWKNCNCPVTVVKYFAIKSKEQNEPIVEKRM